MAMVVRMRHTRSHTRNRRSHHALEDKALSLCSNCGKPKMRHYLCQNCGKHRGREVMDIIGKMAKKEAKKKEKQKSLGVSQKEDKKEE